MIEKSDPCATGKIVEVKIPLRTISELNAREHWAKKCRRHKREAEAVSLVLRAVGPLPTPPMIVDMVRVAPRRLDSDNLYSAFKAIRDAIAREIGVDDGAPAVQWRYGQERGAPRYYGIRISVRGHGE